MADTKISAMTPAAVCESPDLLPLVQAGLNLSVTRVVLLECDTGESIRINKLVGGKVSLQNGAATALIEIDATDNINILNSVGAITVGFAAAIPANWAGAPPATIELAIDRLAAWMVANFPLLPKP
jgi:hypothetical protein